ncbi:Translationally-controlled tumor protein-like protein [Golovinomyces cichoracearum]|uniref:Translationally-controlled tumor protein homolog n=1 Tax=Golovinomyces cichoracearum TaxID=62708 RepID=A0A420HFE5_9PEZI|nr:Translationally-controlled tumor protein-like protein [Golovinomyces cichoracearum]
MIIYKDIITDDEILSDSYLLKEVDGIVYECDCAMINLKGPDVDIGANPSVEEATEDLDESAQTVNNVVNSFRLQSLSFDKKSYLQHLKSYMKMVKDKMTAKGATEEDITNFVTKAQIYAKKIIGKFKDYEFYTGESLDPDGMVILLNYRDDGITPYVTVWKDGLVPMKV